MSIPVTGAAMMGPDGVDPRMDPTVEKNHQMIYEEEFDLYLYYAALEREREDNDPRPIPDAPWTVVLKRLLGKSDTIVRPEDQGPPPPLRANNEFARGQGASPVEGANVEKTKKHVGTEGYETGGNTEVTTGVPEGDIVTGVSAGERETAYRLLRVASWQIVFYMITTDILGFSSAPEAFQELGYGPGVLVYTIFYVLAFASGQVIWRMYMRLDSEKFPVTCYADIGERLFGRWVRHAFNILQSLQLLFNVAILIIGQGQTLAYLINFKFCYLALNVFWAIAGIIVGQIKSLRNFAWFTNVNIWLNIVTMILTMVGIGLYPPVPGESGHTSLSQPIITSGWVPSYTIGWYEQVSGVQLAVFAYGGAMIFTEFMAEMRRPRDFWKAAFVAQLFCYLMYMFFGLFCYAFQGQYASILPGLDFANTQLALAANIIGLYTTGIAMVLYANIGIKVFYQNVMREYFKAPPLVSKRGSFLWVILVFVYWAIAWVIGSAIPNITSLVTLIGAACILQFTYTFPPLLLCGYWVQRDAIEGDQPWEPGMEIGSGRVDSWRHMSRWKRGFKRYWYAKVFLITIFVAALCLCALGIYSGVETAIQAYASGTSTSFSCTAPGS